ncbi:MAG: hypothetical protein Q7T54_00810 [Candidatus Levybacteria bacterium]|nr:hypothetical protein [Candidatus Levybacteria bacterium]
MGRIEDVTSRIGIPIKDRSVPGAQIVELLAGNGVMVGRDAIYSVRSGRKTGDRIGARLEMTEILGSNSGKKDDFYGQIADVGTLVRATNEAGHYSTVGFARRIAEEMDLGEPDVSRCLRAMRTELVLSETKDESPRIKDLFREVAEEYLGHYRSGYSSSPVIKDIDAMWSRDSIEEFYRACAITMPAPHSLRTWMAYESDVLFEFYRLRKEMGSPVSAFDRLTLEKNVNGSPIESLINQVRMVTSIPYDQVVHFTHTNALLYGQPTRLHSGNGIVHDETLLVDGASPTSNS